MLSGESRVECVKIIQRFGKHCQLPSSRWTCCFGSAWSVGHNDHQQWKPKDKIVAELFIALPLFGRNVSKRFCCDCIITIGKEEIKLIDKDEPPLCWNSWRDRPSRFPKRCLGNTRFKFRPRLWLSRRSLSCFCNFLGKFWDHFFTYARLLS